MSTTAQRSLRYSRLMHKAATGDRNAARALICEAYFPGDWSLAAEQDKVIAYARDLGY